MALTVEQSKAKPQPVIQPPVDPRVPLVLVKMKNYTVRIGPGNIQHFVEKVVYRFTQEQADELLAQTDEYGNSLWKRYVPERKKVMNHDGMEVRDMSHVDMSVPEGVMTLPKGIHVGDDSELAGILPADGDNGEITV